MDQDSDPLNWCEERATSLALLVDPTEVVEVEHVCRHNEQHEGPHACMWCETKWDMEVPC